MARLTPRETQVLRLIAHGMPSKAIAGELGIKERTVRWHVARIFAKLNATSRAEAVAVIGGDYAQGGVEATAATDHIQAAINAGRMDLPNTANHGVYLYLDIEYPGGFLSQDFWNGWYDSLRNRFITSPAYGTWQPIYPAAYANPNDASTMAILKTAGRTAYGIWTPNPSSVNCNYCQAPGPDISNAVGSQGLTLHMWQYGLAGACGPLGLNCGSGRPNVDLDETNPDFTQTNFMLWLA